MQTLHDSLKDHVEAFLFEEADLLDNWRLAEWEALLTGDAQYLVPPIGMPYSDSLSPDSTLFLVADDRDMLAARVDRLMGKTAYCELPRSNVRHMLSNIRILAQSASAVTVASNFCIYRIRRAEITTYIGQYRHHLQRAGETFKIRAKHVILDIDVLRGQGGIGIIL